MIFWYRIMPFSGGGVNLSEWFEVHALMVQENCNCTLPAPPPPSLLSPSFSDDIDQSLMLSTMPNPTINCTRPRPPPQKKKFNSLINYVRITSLHSLWYYNDDDSDWGQTSLSCCKYPTEAIHRSLYQLHRETRPSWKRNMMECWHRRARTRYLSEHSLNQCLWCWDKKTCES